MAFNNYNQGTVQEQIERVQGLMGINKKLAEEKSAPLGTIEKTEIAKDGKCYAIIKENNKYYLKKSDQVKDIKLDNFEYLGGSFRYKNLFEYNSYNQAEKILKEELYNISKDVKKQAILAEQVKRVDMNLAQIAPTKEMRTEINRQREIINNASKILKENSGINELSIDDDEQILTDDEGGSESEEEEVISLDDEIEGDEGSEGGEDIENLSDEQLDKEDVKLDQQLVDVIEPLLAKLDDLNAKLEDLTGEGDDFEEEISIDDEDGGLEGDDFEESIDGDTYNEEFEEEEDPIYEDVELSESDIKTWAAHVTEKQFGYENAKGDPKGRNEIPDYKKEDEIGPNKMFTDTLSDVKKVAKNGKDSRKVSSDTYTTTDNDDDDLTETQKFDWELDGKGGKNIADHEGSTIKNDPFTAKRARTESKNLFIVERDGTVRGTVAECDFKSMLGGKKPKGNNNHSKPFEKKVQNLTDSIFNECVQAGIFKPKK
jgi:hypothetical protein